MFKSIFVLLACFCLAPAMAAEDSVSGTPAAGAATSTEIDAAQMEKDLQQLNWKQFRSVVEAVPKMKADVDAYGPLGWQYVQSNYKTYAWKKSIDKLDAEQKHQLADLIGAARKAQ